MVRRFLERSRREMRERERLSHVLKQIEHLFWLVEFLVWHGAYSWFLEYGRFVRERTY